jgi:hypothetical protein
VGNEKHTGLPQTLKSVSLKFVLPRKCRVSIRQDTLPETKFMKCSINRSFGNNVKKGNIDLVSLYSFKYHAATVNSKNVIE